MAEKNDRYKEGRDFVWVDKGSYKTRKFLTAKEKAEGAKPKAEAAKPAAKAKTKAKPTKSEPMPKSKVPMTREKRAERKKIVRDTREVIDRTSPARSVKGKTAATTPKAPKVSYSAWKSMSRSERKAKGYPVSVTGFQNWRQ